MSELRARLVLKVDKDQVDAQLSRRPTWTEIEGVMREKADIGGLERIAMQKVGVVVVAAVVVVVVIMVVVVVVVVFSLCSKRMGLIAWLFTRHNSVTTRVLIPLFR